MTKKKRLVPFDYEMYKAGHTAVFNEKILPRLSNETIINIYNNSRIRTYLVVHTFDGLIDHLYIDNEYLLLEIELEEKTFYLNVYSGCIEPYKYESLKDAQETVQKDNDFYQGVLKVTYTEEDLIK